MKLRACCDDITVVGEGSVYAYFFNGSMQGLTPSEFMKLGGLEIDQDALLGKTQPFYAYLLERFPDRAVPISIGPYAGVVTWADPDVNGVRTHNVYWSDGEFNCALITDASAAAVITLARGLAC